MKTGYAQVLNNYEKDYKMIGSEYKTIQGTTSNMLSELNYYVMIKNIIIFNEDATNDALITISVNDPIGFTLHKLTLPSKTTISLTDILGIQPGQELIIESSTTINIVVTYIEDKGITLV